MNTTTQCKQILEALKQGPITSKEAADKYGVSRLAARIYNLRHKGYKIIKDTKKVRNRYGRCCCIAEYRLEANY